MAPRKRGKKGYSKKAPRDDDAEEKRAASNPKGTPFQYASDELKSDKRFVIETMTNNPMALQDVSEELKVDPDVVVAAVNLNGSAWQFVSKECRRDKDFILAVVSRSASILEYTSETMKSDSDVVLAAVTQDGTLLQFASGPLKRDRNIVTAAVTNDSEALKYASKALKGDREVVMSAIGHNCSALRFASIEIKNDKDFILSAANQSGCILEYVSDQLQGNKDIVLAAVAQDGDALRFSSDILKRDEDIVLAAVRQKESALQYAPDQFRRVRKIAEASSALPSPTSLLDTMTMVNNIDWIKNMQLHVQYRYETENYITKDDDLLRDTIIKIHNENVNADRRADFSPDFIAKLQDNSTDLLNNPEMLFDMAQTLCEVAEDHFSLARLGACAAAMRLYTYHEANKSNDLSSAVNRCIGYFPTLVPLILFKSVEAKLRGNASRPFFSVDKLKRFEDELGVGLCSEYYHKCNNCGISHTESSLARCSRCRRVWYCTNNDCFERDWYRHKEHECKDKWRTKVFYFQSRDRYMITKSLVEKDIELGGSGISMQVDRKTQELILFCLDPDTKELFDGFTDRPVFVID